MTVRLLVGDAQHLDLEDESVDAIVCDPPYELGFMGRDWDAAGVAFDVATWAEALRVAKPGAHLISFGAPRTFPEMAVAVRMAGWERRDTLSWLFGSGFPKSLDVSKALDREAGAERVVVGMGAAACAYLERGEACPGHGDAEQSQSGATVHVPRTAPVTDLARQWEGWGTALKPAWEPIVLARKPLRGTVAQNVAAFGTGALNIDGSRIGTEERTNAAGSLVAHGIYGSMARNESSTVAVGRWPANVMLDEAAAARLDASVGETTSQQSVRNRAGATFGNGLTHGAAVSHYDNVGGFNDSGGPSRFFFTSREQSWSRNVRVVSDAGIQCGSCGTVTALSPAQTHPGNDQFDRGRVSTGNFGSSTQRRSRASSAENPGSTATIPTIPNFCGSCGSVLVATVEHINSGSGARAAGDNGQESGTRFWYTSKASRTEREAGLDDLEPVSSAEITGRKEGSAGLKNPRASSTGAPRRNTHPTVKPLDLMRWLVTLVTPPGGVVLDQFMGSGSTGVAAVELGFSFIGIDRDPHYVEIARRRITHERPMRMALGDAAL